MMLTPDTRRDETRPPTKNVLAPPPPDAAATGTAPRPPAGAYGRMLAVADGVMASTPLASGEAALAAGEVALAAMGAAAVCAVAGAAVGLGGSVSREGEVRLPPVVLPPSLAPQNLHVLHLQNLSHHRACHMSARVGRRRAGRRIIRRPWRAHLQWFAAFACLQKPPHVSKEKSPLMPERQDLRAPSAEEDGAGLPGDAAAAAEGAAAVLLLRRFLRVVMLRWLADVAGCCSAARAAAILSLPLRLEPPLLAAQKLQARHLQ